MIETARSRPLALTNTYQSLALNPTKDIHVSIDDIVTEEAVCASHGEASHPSAGSPNKSFGLKNDDLADMFEIYHIVTVSRMLLPAWNIQTNPGEELRSCLHENQTSLDQGRSRLGFGLVRCLAYQCGSAMPSISIAHRPFFGVTARRGSSRAL